MRRFDDFWDILSGVFFLGMVADVVTHPEGMMRLSDSIQWAVVYEPDWDYYASRFTD
jgi:hypothetical protein